MVKGANSAPFFLLAEAALNRKENSGSFDGTACIFACATISRYKVFPGILGHSLSSFFDSRLHPVPAARKIASIRKPFAQPREANEVKMNKNSKKQLRIAECWRESLSWQGTSFVHRFWLRVKNRFS
jgi:hypothetical protein